MHFARNNKRGFIFLYELSNSPKFQTLFVMKVISDTMSMSSAVVSIGTSRLTPRNGTLNIIDKTFVSHPDTGAFHLRTSVYHLRTLISSFVHDSAYHLHTFFTPH